MSTPHHDDVWIFGYGSLMWDPGFPHVAVRPALLRGYHRRFCVLSHQHRGTPDRPGLVLVLARGGASRGLAFRVAAPDAVPVMAYLWEREMMNRVYAPKLLSVQIPEGRIQAHAFVADPRHRQYAGRLTLEETIRLICQGVGGRGTCRDYLVNTARRLAELGIEDESIGRLLGALDGTSA